MRLDVEEGTDKPYYLAERGINEKGVYVRQGSSSAPASPRHIKKMIYDSIGQSFEVRRAVLQELTFDYAKTYCEERGLSFSPDKYLRLGLIQPDTRAYTNAAMLLSDQCSHTIKVGVFADSANTVFRDAQTFGGSVFKQLEEASEYIMHHNRTPAVIRSMVREEFPDYAPDAIREALVNAVVHREYSFHGSITVNINSAQIEIVSHGGIPGNITIGDIENGLSEPRNRNLADVFHRLRLIEAYGTGIRRIMHSYDGYAVQPTIVAADTSFRIVLPNRNFGGHVDPDLPARGKGRLVDGGQTAVGARAHERPEEAEVIVQYLREHSSITVSQVMELLNCKQTRAYAVIREMRAQNELVRVPTRRGYYQLSEAAARERPM